MKQKREKIQCRTKEGHKPKLRDCFCLKDCLLFDTKDRTVTSPVYS